MPSDEYQVEDEVITIDIEPFPVQRMVSEETSRVEPDIELLHSNNRQSVNLCGAVTITEVRALLKEWINSSPGRSNNFTNGSRYDYCIMYVYVKPII